MLVPAIIIALLVLIPGTWWWVRICIWVLAVPVAVSGFFLLGFTNFGYDTYRTYCRTCRALRRYSIDYVREGIVPESYCHECGFDLALNDARNGRV